MSTATNDLVLRYQWEAYMDCGSAGTPDFELIGEGFTTLPESKNPKEYTRKYVNYKTEKTDVIGYAPSIGYSCDVILNDPVVAEIIQIHDGEFLGTDTHRDIVSVNCWDEEDYYFHTADTNIVSGKTYYTKSGDTYTAVQSPTAENLSTYYEKGVGYAASKRTFAIIPDGKGDGTDAMIYTGTMKAVSDKVDGVFDRTSKTFTPNS